MVRTQIYLTESERKGLNTVARFANKRQSEVIRDAIDRFLETAKDEQRKAVLDNAAGIWKERNDLPDFNAIRHEWDRG